MTEPSPPREHDLLGKLANAARRRLALRIRLSVATNGRDRLAGSAHWSLRAFSEMDRQSAPDWDVVASRLGSAVRRMAEDARRNEYGSAGASGSEGRSRDWDTALTEVDRHYAHVHACLNPTYGGLLPGIVQPVMKKIASSLIDAIPPSRRGDPQVAQWVIGALDTAVERLPQPDTRQLEDAVRFQVAAAAESMQGLILWDHAKRDGALHARAYERHFAAAEDHHSAAADLLRSYARVSGNQLGGAAAAALAAEIKPAVRDRQAGAEALTTTVPGEKAKAARTAMSQSWFRMPPSLLRFIAQHQPTTIDVPGAGLGPVNAKSVAYRPPAPAEESRAAPVNRGAGRFPTRGQVRELGR